MLSLPSHIAPLSGLFLYVFQGDLHLKPELSMFCAVSQNDQQFFENNSINRKQIVWGT